MNITTQTIEDTAKRIMATFPPEQAAAIAKLILAESTDEITATRYLVTSALGQKREVLAKSAYEASDYAEGYWIDWTTASVKAI